MIATSFRLLIVVAEPLSQLTRERQRELSQRIHSILSRASGRLRIEMSPLIPPPRFRLTGDFPEAAAVSEPARTLLSVQVTVPLAGAEFQSWASNLRVAFAEAKEAGLDIQSDLPLLPALWADAGRFGTRQQALTLIRAQQFAAPEQPERVSVVIVDQGFDSRLFPNNFAGGIAVDGRVPGKGDSAHAAMIARNVLSVAPHARLYDCPLIPTPPLGFPALINDLPAFTQGAASLCEWVAIPLVALSNAVCWGSWIFVNAWAVYDRSTDIGWRHYADDPHHVLNEDVQLLIAAGSDVVFAAGNCGQFDPDRRCAFNVKGPGRSILGANSLKPVITVGAIRLELVPLGFCSQGPGQPRLGCDKPDVCAPSQFTEDDDAANLNSGTSAAAGLAGGVVAALRGLFPTFPSPNQRSPARLQSALIDAALAVPPWGEVEGVGAGVVDLAGTAARLRK